MTNRYGMPDECTAFQQSDQMYCERCNLRWDMNDDDPPKCEPKEYDARRVTSSGNLDDKPGRNGLTYQAKYTAALAFIASRGLYSDFMKALGAIE